MEKKGKEVVGSTRLGKGRYIPRKEAEPTGRESGDAGYSGGCFGKVIVCAHKLILMAEVQMCLRSP